MRHKKKLLCTKKCKEKWVREIGEIWEGREIN